MVGLDVIVDSSPQIMRLEDERSIVPTDPALAFIDALIEDFGDEWVTDALMSGADDVVCEVDGREYREGPFKYQAKCLQWLRDGYAALGDGDQARVDSVLSGTGCEQLFA